MKESKKVNISTIVVDISTKKVKESNKKLDKLTKSRCIN